MRTASHHANPVEKSFRFYLACEPPSGFLLLVGQPEQIKRR
jgi:hypothetical protein